MMHQTQNSLYASYGSGNLHFESIKKIFNFLEDIVSEIGYYKFLKVQ